MVIVEGGCRVVKTPRNDTADLGCHVVKTPRNDSAETRLPPLTEVHSSF